MVAARFPGISNRKSTLLSVTIHKWVAGSPSAKSCSFSLKAASTQIFFNSASCFSEKPLNTPIFHLPSTMSIPSKTRLLFSRASLPTRSVSEDLSKATTCETFATESFGRPVRRASRSTFPGASAHFRLLVSATHRTVAILLRLKGSPCTTITGRRNPGPEPAGSGRSAHQISPWEITTRHAPEFGWKPT
jgi:hypothetical protein